MIAYNLIFDTPEQELVIDWGNSPDWQSVYSDIISKATRLTLVPKVNGLPIVSVVGNKFTVFRRIHGRMNSSKKVMVYCIESGANSPLWIYENGTIEQGSSPTFVNDIFRAIE